MPKLKSSTNRQSDLILATIRKYMVLRHVDSTIQLAKLCVIKQSTMYGKMKNPETFSVQELKMVFDALRVPQEERGMCL